MTEQKVFVMKFLIGAFNLIGSLNFLQIKADKTDSGELIGAFQARKYSHLPEKINGLECTLGIEKLTTLLKKLKIIVDKCLCQKLPFLMWVRLQKILDTEGNIICVMQYDNSAR